MISPHDMSAQTEPDGLVVFDGVCNLCSATVETILALDRRGAIRFSAAQSPYGRLLCARACVDPDNPSTFLFFEHGRPLDRSDAMAALLARLPPPWRWMRRLDALPRPLRDAAYDFTARNRYRLFGRRRTCLMPDPALRERFVDAVPPGCTADPFAAFFKQTEGCLGPDHDLKY